MARRGAAAGDARAAGAERRGAVMRHAGASPAVGVSPSAARMIVSSSIASPASSSTMRPA